MFWLISVGVLHLKDGESPPQGGKPGWAALPSTRIGPWFRLLKKMAEAHGLVPEFEVFCCLLSLMSFAFDWN